MKKIAHRILSVIICVAVMITPLSANFDESDATTVFAVESIISSGYDEIFASDNQISRTYSNNVLQDTATITYELTIDEDDPTKGYLSFQITLLINGNLCSCLANGEVEAVELSNDKYWDGYVQGDLCVEEKIYNDVYIHFNKLDSREDIRISLSISTDQGPTSLVFGNLLLDEQTYLEIESHRNYGISQQINSPTDSIAPLSIYQPIPGSEYAIIGNGFTNFSYGSLSYYSQRARAYYNANANRLAISLKTYADYLTNYMAQNSAYYNATYITGIHEMTSTLTRVNSNDYSYIINIENPGLINGVSSNNQFLYNVFFDALNALGVPTSTIQYILGSITGSFSNAVYADYSYTRMQSAINDYFDYDDLDYGAPIIYQLGRSTPCNGTYAYSTSVVYKTSCQYPVYEPATGIFQGYATTVTYYDAGTASSTATVYVQ